MDPHVGRLAGECVAAHADVALALEEDALRFEVAIRDRLRRMQVAEDGDQLREVRPGLGLGAEEVFLVDKSENGHALGVFQVRKKKSQANRYILP
jgi:hypothetical protein